MTETVQNIHVSEKIEWKVKFCNIDRTMDLYLKVPIMLFLYMLF